MTRPPLLSRASRVWHEGGMPAVMGCIGERVWRSNSALWHECDLTAHEVLVLQPRLPANAVLDDPHGTAAWLRARPHDPEELACALANGHLLARAELAGRPVAYVKAGWGEVWISDYQRGIDFPDGLSFIYDSYVVPEARRQRIGAALIGGVMGELQKRGFQRLFCHIPERNVASRRLYESLGFSARRRVRFARIFGIRLLSPHPRVLWRPGQAWAPPA